ncbi:MAG: hypothetical protein KAX19_04035, partial [Candidatus Brocadiae bacterium]|nr:hypothetical protein [Candidatus Brocadiia bacterium]
DGPSYGMIYVPAIFALAAPRLDPEARYTLGRFLIRKLDEAGREDSDLLMEVLMAAAGTMGPAILSPLMDTIKAQPDTYGAWFHLWSLTQLAAQAEDAEVRRRTIEACMDLLRRADSGEVAPGETTEAAWTLGRMGHTDCRPLVERLAKKHVNTFDGNEFSGALDLLDGTQDHGLPPELWQRPVREWLQSRWESLRDWYEQADREGWFDEDEVEAGIRRAEELTIRFMDSPQANGLPDEVFEDAYFIANGVLEYAWTYAEAAPEKLDESALREVLLEVFPRKITAEREVFENVAPVTGALLSWLESEGIIENAAPLIRAVEGWADDIAANAMEPRFWGMAKSFAMGALAQGIDPGDEAAMAGYALEQNLRLLDDDDDTGGEDVWLGATPIVNVSPKVGR